MAKNRAEPPRPSAIEFIFDRIALFVMLALIPARSIISEMHTFEVPRLFRHLDASGQANPAYTFFFSFLILAFGAGRLLIRRPTTPRQWRPTGGEIGVLLVAIAGIVSFVVAGQKHLALIGALNFVALLVYMLTLRSLLNSPSRIRLAMYFLVATGVILFAKAGFQRIIEFPKTIEYFEEHRFELTGGGKLASEGMIYDYEQRLRSAEITGYYSHSNVFGSHVVVLLFACLGPVVDRIDRKKFAATFIAPAVVFLMLLYLIFTETGKGPMAAASIGLAFFAIGTIARRIINRVPIATVVSIWLFAIIGAIGVVALLQNDEAALGKSLQFRHMYWRGAADMIADQGLFGVGPFNFGRHFTRYKPVECPEEVESPHSWVVQLLSEWGALGLAGFLIFLKGLSWRLLKPNPRSDETNSESNHLVLWAVVGGAPLLWLLVVLNTSAIANIDIVISTVIAFFPFLVSFLFIAIEDANDPNISNDKLGPIALPMIAGAIAFLVHTSIDLALFEGGPATSFFAVIAIAIAAVQLRKSTTDESPQAPAIAKHPALAIVASLAIGIFGLVLVARSGSYQGYLTDGRQNLLPNGKEVPRSWNPYIESPPGLGYRRAVDAYRLDATAIGELIEQLIPKIRTENHLDETLALANEHIRRDPDNSLGFNLKGTLLMIRAQKSKDVADFEAAIDAFKVLVANYPTDPNRRIHLANALAELADKSKRRDARDAAVEQLETALSLEEKRVNVSKPNRMTSEEIAAIRDSISRLKSMFDHDHSHKEPTKD